MTCNSWEGGDTRDAGRQGKEETLTWALKLAYSLLTELNEWHT